MADQSRGFFERLTGTRLVDQDDEPAGGVAVETDVLEPEDLPEDVEDAVEEVEVIDEDEYSDENQGTEDEGYEGQLTVDVFQDDERIVVQSTIAGVSPEDLDVSITNDMVTIRGERRQQYDVDSEDYFYQECYWGPFSRSIILPVEIDADRAEARIKNGVLTIRIPKANAAVTRKLKVKAS